MNEPTKSFTEADAEYRAAIEAPGKPALIEAFDAANAITAVNFDGNDLNTAVLMRLKSFLLTQRGIKNALGKVYAAPAADFFVETVCFFLKVVLSKFDCGLDVASEKNIVSKRGSMRPDISIWRNGVCIAAIECKTQLGWNRSGWLADFENREARLRLAFPEAKLFLLVMTASNWPGFGDDHRVGSQFFVMLKEIWPDTFDVATAGQYVVDHIEHLFREVMALA